MKKGFYVGLFIALVAAFILNLKKIEQPKKPETAKQTNSATVRAAETSNFWIPENGRIVFMNRLLFLEGEIKERLIRELEIEVKRYKFEGLDSVKNDIWLSYIGKQLKKADLPSDLIYLPIIESSMRATITSNKGAGGYWQFMPGTASLYGLKRTPYVDERFDPIKSTDAAIFHLNYLLDRFDDWTASLGGYNMDPAALIEARKQERTINFYNLKTIPLETQRFPFRLMATKLIFENPEKYGFSKTGWLKEGTYDDWQILEIDLIVGTDSSIDEIVNEMRTEYPKLNTNDFKKFNPQIINDFLPKGNYTVYILKERYGAS